MQITLVCFLCKNSVIYALIISICSVCAVQNYITCLLKEVMTPHLFFFWSESLNFYNGFISYIFCPPLPPFSPLPFHCIFSPVHSAPALLVSLLFLMSVPLPPKSFGSILLFFLECSAHVFIYLSP